MDLPQGVFLRTPTPGDTPSVIAFLSSRLAEFDLTLDFEGTDRDLIDLQDAYGRGFFGILEQNDKIVGTFALFALSEEIAEVRKMYLDKTIRSKGVGSGMLKTLEQIARMKGYKRIELETFSQMHVAISLYSRRGYKEMIPAGCGDRCDRRFFKELKAPVSRWHN